MMLFAVMLLGASWESVRVPAGATPPQGLWSMEAKDCGACHQEIYREWQVSTHAHAWTDAQYQQELAKDPEVAWVCNNCHTPAGDQQAQISVSTGDVRHPERSDNASYSERWQQEGITCLSCHWDEGKIRGPFGDTNAPHPTVKDEQMLKSDLCMECHQAVARVEDTLVCSFNTGVEWAEAQTDETCQSCHMPAVTRPLVAGYPDRPVRRHLFIGSKIPKGPLRAGDQAYYDMFSPGMDVSLSLPPHAAPGTLVNASFVLDNTRAGHAIPTGDPERYIWAEAVVRDSQGQVISRTTQRLGQRWIWWPVAERLDDNRLGPGERREIPLSFVMPEGGVTVELVVEHHRISAENAASLEGYPTKTEVAHLTQTLVPTP